MLNYQEFSSSPRVKPYIRKFWALDNLSSSLPTDIHYALPNTCFTLGFVNGNGIMITQGDCSQFIGEGVFVAGQISCNTGISVMPHSKAFMVQLNAHAASLLTNCPFHELTNSFVQLTDINKQVGHQLTGLNVWQHDVLKFEVEKVLNRVLQPSTASALIAHGFYVMQTNALQGNFTIKHLSEQLGCSPRMLEKQFKQKVGLTPKQVHNILKVRSAVDDLLSGDARGRLTELAYQYGYFDQAHFIKAFKSVMNTTPGKFDRKNYLLPLQM